MDLDLSFKEADHILRRDWFMSSEDIDDLLWKLYEEVYQEVFEIRHTYSQRIQDVFYKYETRPPSRVKELTDEMMEEIWREEYELFDKKRTESLNKFVAPPRPRTIWDDQYDELKNKIDKYYVQLEKYNQKPKYHTQDIERVVIAIGTVQNEFESLKERIEQQDKNWHELQWIESVVFAGVDVIW